MLHFLIGMTNPASADTLSFSLVIPCYNESGRVEALMQGLEVFSKQFKYPFEIILVDDGSTDDTIKKIESHAFYRAWATQKRFILIKLNKNQGKGAALKAGVAASSNNYILTLDADLSTSPNELNNFSKHLTKNKILIASREHKDSKITADKSRKRIGRIFNFIVRILTPLNLLDTQCGFKLYPAAVAKELFNSLRTNGWAHDVELLYKAHHRGYIIQDLPITWKNMEGSKINMLVDSLKMFLEVLRISFSIRFEHLFLDPFQKQNRHTDQLCRGLFAIASVFLLVFMAALSFDYGITGDDMDQKVYGEKVLNYYTSFGKDTSCLHLKIGNKENLHLYGGLFPMLSAALNRYIGGIDEYAMRHLLNAVTGASAIIVTGLLAYSISGSWLAACFAFIILTLWPQFFGHSMNNPKDIPFALGYILTIYFLMQMVKELPAMHTRTLLKLIAAIAFTINIRVGGLILIGMLGAFYFGAFILSPAKRKAILSFGVLFKHLRSLAIVVIAAYFLGLLFWPYGLIAPFSHPFIALKESTNFSMPIGLFFEGKLMTSKDIPWYYVPKWLWITTPVITLFSALLFGLIWFINRSNIAIERSLLLIFAALFPWAYAVYKKSPMYDAMRQMLFLVPMLSVMAALTWHYIIHLFKNKMAQRIVAAVFILALSPVVRFCVANHPNQYVYFNELVGGITKARLLYDTDYYMNSVKQCADWFKQSEMFRNADAQHKIRIATNTLDPVNHYFKDDTDKVKIIYTKWFSPGNEKSRANRDWDYGIYNSRTVEPAQLKYGIWPSEKTIYSATADGVPLSVIIERKDKSDYLGYLAFKKDSFELASTLYKKAIAYNKQNEEAYINLIQSLMNIKQYQECLVYCSQWHTVNPDNDLAYVYEGIALAYSGNIDQAFTPLQTAIKMNPDNYQAYTILAQLYNQKGDKQSAQYYYNQAELVRQKLSGN